MEIFGITNLTAFILGTIFIVLLPGPNSLFVLTVAIKRGKLSGFKGACGVFTGDAILMLLTIFGAEKVLKSHTIIFEIMRFVGAGYLGYLGLGLIWGGIKKLTTQKQSNINVDIENESKLENITELSHPYWRALIISIMNPKAIFFFLFFFITFIDVNYTNLFIPFIVEASIVQFFSAVYLSMLIFFGTIVAEKFRDKIILNSLLNIFVGLLFCAYGLNLALFLKA